MEEIKTRASSTNRDDVPSFDALVDPMFGFHSTDDERFNGDRPLNRSIPVDILTQFKLTHIFENFDQVPNNPWEIESLNASMIGYEPPVPWFSFAPRYRPLTHDQLTQVITMIEERQRMSQEAGDVEVAGGIVTETKQEDDEVHLSDYKYINSAGSVDFPSGANQVRSTGTIHTEMGLPSLLNVPQDVRIDIIEPDKTVTIRGFKIEQKEGRVELHVHPSSPLLSEIILGITGQAAISLLGFGLANNTIPKAALSFVVSANAVGFIATLAATALRNKKREAGAGILGKVGAIAAASAAIMAMGMHLPVDLIWASGIACLIPAAAIAFA